MHDTITIPEGTLTIEVIPGDYTTGFSDPEFLPRLKVHGTVKAGQTYHIEMRRELRRTWDQEDAADAAEHGYLVLTGPDGFYFWRNITGTGLPDKAATASGKRAGDTTRSKLQAIVDRECSNYHRDHPEWEEYSLRLHHIRQYQLAIAHVAHAQHNLDHATAAAQRIRDEHRVTGAEATLEVPR